MTLIQVGCHEGKDIVQNYIIKNYNNITRAVLIDANEECIEKCKINYNNLSKVEFLHYAIVPDDAKIVNFYIPCSSWDHTPQGSVSKVFVETGGFDYKVVETPAINLNNLFKQLNIFHIDRLYIDAESLDIDIVNSIDLERFDINFIYFEKLHSEARLISNGAKYCNCIQRLKNYNYTVTAKDWEATAIKNS